MNILEHFFIEHIPDLLKHMKNNNVGVEMYASDWVFALYTNIIPSSVVHHFLN